MAPQPYARLSGTSGAVNTGPVDHSHTSNIIFEAPHPRSSHIPPSPSSPPPSFHSRASAELDHLVDAFGGSSDSELDEEEQDWDDDRHVIVQSKATSQQRGRGGGLFGGVSSADRYQSLQDRDPNASSEHVNNADTSTDADVDLELRQQQGATNITAIGSETEPPRVSVPSIPRPIRRDGLFSRLPWLGGLGRSLTGAGSGGGAANQNDGVFANITAKPEVDGPNNEDFPPTYEEAAADQTPPYWETTIMTSGYGDEVFIEGLPVGSPINFVWNMVVSSAFQFVGFMLTYLLHTSHAAKQGSRAGLGFTLFQYGFYLQPSVAGDATAPAKEFEPNQPNNYNVNAKTSGVGGSFSNNQGGGGGASSSSSSSISIDSTDASGWISIFLMILGAILILKAVVDYMRARKMELVIQGPSHVTASPIESEDSDSPESMV